MSNRDLKKVRKVWNTRTLSKLLFSVNPGIFSTTQRSKKKAESKTYKTGRGVAMTTGQFLINIVFPNQCDTCLNEITKASQQIQIHIL